MKKFTTKTGETIRKIGREKRIYFNEKGCYFLWNRRRRYLEDIPRLCYPLFFIDENGKLDYISGYITVCNVYGVYVAINDNETITLYEPIEA